MTWLHRLWLRLEPTQKQIDREMLDRLTHPPRRTYGDETTRERARIVNSQSPEARREFWAAHTRDSVPRVTRIPKGA